MKLVLETLFKIESPILLFLLERPENGRAAGLRLVASILGVPGIAAAIQSDTAGAVGLGLLDIRRT